MYGKLGVGNENGSSVLVLVDKLRDQFVINVACGSRTTVALTNKSSEVYSWGDCESTYFLFRIPWISSTN